VAIDPGKTGHGWLLIRRNRRTRELAFYRCHSPRHVPLPALVKIAGIRWTAEENFQAAKGLTGLDEHQVRRWASWYRWTTLAMLALAFLTIASRRQSRAQASSSARSVMVFLLLVRLRLPERRAPHFPLGTCPTPGRRSPGST